MKGLLCLYHMRPGIDCYAVNRFLSRKKYKIATVFNFSTGNNISIKPIPLGHKFWERHIGCDRRQHKDKRELCSFIPA